MVEWALSSSPNEEPTKKNIADLLFEHFEQNGIELFSNEEDVGCILVALPEGGFDAMPLRSKRGRLFIRGILHRDFSTILRSNDLSDLINTLETKAIFEKDRREFKLRIGGHENQIIFDLGNKERHVVICSKEGWRVSQENPVIFRRREGYGALPIPVSGDGLERLRQFLFIEDDHTWHCLLGFLINTLRPEGPYCCLIVDGEQGSGKSFLSELIKKIIDPNLVAKLRFPKSVRDLMIQANQFFLIVFDNASGIRQGMSDSLCTLATGGGFATRSLHTDDDLKIFNVCRPFILNGIGGFAYNPDLLERGIHVTLPTMDDDKRKTEAELNAEFERILPGVLGALMDGIVVALQNYDQTPTPRGIRMADAARWIAAAEPALGVPKGSLIRALRKSQDETMATVAIETALAQGLINVLHLHEGSFKGGYNNLLRDLLIVDANKNKDPYFPKTASHLSKKLTRLAPALKRAGIEVTKLARTNEGSQVEIRFDGSVEYTKPQELEQDF